MNPKFIIDGKMYNSLEEMPPDVRQKYEQVLSSLKDTNGNSIPDALENVNILADKNKNGIPDLLEGLASTNVVSSMKIIVDGKEFDSVESLPSDIRAEYEAAMAKLDANGNGIPDFAEGINAPKHTVTISTKFKLQTPRLISSLPAPTSDSNLTQDKPLTVSPTATQTPDTSNGWMLALSGLFLFLLCIAGAAGVWYFFLR